MPGQSTSSRGRKVPHTHPRQLRLPVASFVVVVTRAAGLFEPVRAPSIAFDIDLLLAVVVGALSALLYLSSSRLISREKLLP